MQNLNVLWGMPEARLLLRETGSHTKGTNRHYIFFLILFAAYFIFIARIIIFSGFQSEHYHRRLVCIANQCITFLLNRLLRQYAKFFVVPIKLFGLEFKSMS